jgi:hypothetical protein
MLNCLALRTLYRPVCKETKVYTLTMTRPQFRFGAAFVEINDFGHVALQKMMGRAFHSITPVSSDGQYSPVSCALRSAYTLSGERHAPRIYLSGPVGSAVPAKLENSYFDNQVKNPACRSNHCRSYLPCAFSPNSS